MGVFDAISKLGNVKTFKKSKQMGKHDAYHLNIVVTWTNVGDSYVQLCDMHQFLSVLIHIM